MNDICFELSSSWQSDFDTTPIKLQRIRHRQRLPPYFYGNCGAKFAENVAQVANAYRSKPFGGGNFCERDVLTPYKAFPAGIKPTF
jgi:hypothetical protein